MVLILLTHISKFLKPKMMVNNESELKARNICLRSDKLPAFSIKFSTFMQSQIIESVKINLWMKAL